MGVSEELDGPTSNPGADANGDNVDADDRRQGGRTGDDPDRGGLVLRGPLSAAPIYPAEADRADFD